jgi:ribosomal protein S18 acetylase RimI-like enzyme
MDNLQIRNASVVDATTVVAWFSDHEAARSWGGPAVPDPLTAEWLAAELNDSEHVYRTAAGAGVVVGFYSLRLFASEARGHLRRFATAPSQRRRGLGRILMEDAANEAARRGFRRLTLNVYGSNLGARQAYERLGWRVIDSSAAPEDASGLRYAMELQIVSEQQR